MNAVVILWSMISAVSLTLGIIHLAVWAKSRKAVSLAFAVAAISVSAIALFELSIMHAADAAEFGRLIQLAHVPVFTLFGGFVVFVRLHLGGSWRFALAIIAVRFVSLVLNFAFPPNLNYKEIISLQTIDFLGCSVQVVGEAVRNPLLPIAELSILLTLAFAVLAMRECWRRNGAGDRRKALLIGGSYVVYVALMLVLSMLLHRGVIHIPYLISSLFLAIIAIMGYELSRDVIESAQLSDQLKDNLASMRLATRAARMATWSWDLASDGITTDELGRPLYGVGRDERVTFGRFIESLHPDDRPVVRAEVEAARRERREFKADYRVILPGGDVRWINAIGAFIHKNGGAEPVRMIGVSMDITDRKKA